MYRLRLEQAKEKVDGGEEVVLRGDIFRGRGRDRTLLLRNNTILTEIEIEALKRQGFKEVFVADGADEAEDLALLEEQREIADRLGALTDATKDTLTKGISSGEEGYNIDVKGVLAVMESVLKSLKDNKDLVQFLGSIEDLDEGLFQHLSRVCCLSIALGLRMQQYMNQNKMARGFKVDITDKWLVNLATGALFHDIGKIKDEASMEFFRKEDSHDSKEWDRVKEHTIDGFDMLAEMDEPAIRGIARNHHQRYDGTGYPANEGSAPKKGDEIDFFSRIVAICNAYDRLLNYEDPWGQSPVPVVALCHLRKSFKGYFDPVIEKEFFHMVNPFPKGDDVILTGGIRAKVAKYQEDDPCRPMVILMAKNTVGKFVPYKPIDLSQKRNEFEIIGHRGHFVSQFLYDIVD